MTGPGKYDELCTYVREQTGADGVMLIIVDGTFGHGFSRQFARPELADSIPWALRQMADQIENDTKRRN